VEICLYKNEIQFYVSWDFGTKTWNMTIAVNGVIRRVELPLIKESSELFSPRKGWVNTNVFGVLLDDQADGNNEIVMDNNMAIGVSE
jgi:alpha-galactosidase